VMSRMISAGSERGRNMLGISGWPGAQIGAAIAACTTNNPNAHAIAMTRAVTYRS